MIKLIAILMIVFNSYDITMYENDYVSGFVDSFHWATAQYNCMSSGHRDYYNPDDNRPDPDCIYVCNKSLEWSSRDRINAEIPICEDYIGSD